MGKNEAQKDGSNDEQAKKWLDALLTAKGKDGWPGNEDVANYFQALEYWLGDSIGDGGIMRVLTSMFEKGESSLQQFKEGVKAFKKQKHQPGASTEEWIFIVPFQIAFSPEISPKVHLFGRTYEFWNSAKVGELIANPKSSRPWNRKLDQIVYEQPYQSYLVLRTKAGSLNSGWQEVGTGFDALLGLLEFTFGLGGRTFHLGGKANAQTRFPRPKWLICYSAKAGAELSWFLTEYGEYAEKPSTPVSVKEFKTLTYNTSLLAGIPEKGSVHALIEAGLSLYGEAMDGRQAHSRLLRLWQLAETLTLSERFGGRTEIVCKRLQAFTLIWSLDNSALKAALLGVAGKRNDLVHNGVRHHIEDRHVHTLKLAVESLLFRLIGNAKKIKTINALEHYYQLHSRSDGDIASLKQALKFLDNSNREKERRLKKSQG